MTRETKPLWRSAFSTAVKTVKRNCLRKWVITELNQKALYREALPARSCLEKETEIHAWKGTDAVFRSYKEYSKGRPRVSSEGYVYSPGAMFVVWGKAGSGKTSAINALANCNTPCLPSKALSLHLQGDEDPYDEILDLLNFPCNTSPIQAANDLFDAVKQSDDTTLSVSHGSDDDYLGLLQLDSAEDPTFLEHKKYGVGDKRPVIAIHNVNMLEKGTKAYIFFGQLMRLAAECRMVIFVTTNDEKSAYLLLQLNEGTKVCPLVGFKEYVDEWDENDSHHKKIIQYLGHKPKFEYMIRAFDFAEDDKVQLLQSIHGSAATEHLRRFVHENQKLSLKALIERSPG